MNWKKLIALIIAILILLLNIFIIKENLLGLKSGKLTDFSKRKNEYSENVIERGNSYAQIAVITIDDVILPGHKHEQLMSSLEAIRSSSHTKGVIVYIDTPGGGTYESAQIADKIKQIKEEKTIPFYAVMGGMAASGGYYVASVCDKIYAMPDTTTGSIGVIISSTNFSQLFNNHGIQVDVIKSGPFKDIASSSKIMSDEERQILQTQVDNAYNRFIEVVSKGRDIPIETVRQIADGRIYDGQQAMELKLIDEFGYYESAVEGLKKDLNLTNPEIVSYDYSESYNDLFSLLSTTYTNIQKSELQKNLEAVKLIQQQYQDKPMYLYGGM